MKSISILIVAAAAMGCATTPVPADKYARARAGIKSAEVMNVERLPNAAAQLQLAREQLEQAKRLLQDGENERAGLVLLKAEADADVAVNMAKAAWAKQEAMQTVENVRQLKAQLEVPQS